MPYMDSAGVRLYYEETGSGDPVVWIHEFAADYRTWELQVRRFSRDYRCVTYNARGYPPSGVPDQSTDYGYERHRDDVIRLMDHLGIDRAHLVGLSMGAYAGLQVAMTYPSRVRSLVFSSGGSGAYVGGRERFVQESGRSADAIMRVGMEAAADSLTLGPARVQLRNKDVRGWLEMRGYLKEHSAVGSALTLKNYQALRPSIYDYEAQLGQMDLPVLLVVGDEDDAVIEANVFLKRALPRAGMLMLPKTGHSVNLEEPDEYNRHLADFLAAVERGAWHRRDPAADPARPSLVDDDTLT